MIKKISKIYFNKSTWLFAVFFYIFANTILFSQATDPAESKIRVKNKVFTLKDKLEQAERGDYIITLQKGVYTLLAVKNKARRGSENILVLEEAALAQNFCKNKKASLKEQFQKQRQKNYPDGLTWNLYEIDLDKKALLKALSLKQNTSFNLSGSGHFLLKLLTLPLKPIAEDKRKKIGPPPQGKEPDRRKLWQPAKFFEGKRIANPRFIALEAFWPKDASELSAKSLEFYFDAENSNFPFPYFIQVNAAELSVFLKSADSGRNFFNN